MTGETYQARKLKGECTYSVACKRLLAPDSDKCHRHTRKRAELDAKNGPERREAHRARGLCAFCPAKSKTYRCPACAIRHGQIPRTSNNARNNARASVGARVSAVTRKHADGRTRYHGHGVRGQPPRVVQDASDFAVIAKALHWAKEGTAHVEHLKATGAPSSEVKSAERAVMDHVYEVRRFAGEILERHGVKLEPQLPED